MNVAKLVKDYISRTRNDSLNDVIIKGLLLPTCVGMGPLMMTSLIVINQFMVTNMLPIILEVIGYLKRIQNILCVCHSPCLCKLCK